MMKKCIFTYLLILLLLLISACGKTKPPTAAELLNLGEKYLLELDYEQAIVAFEKLIEIDPKNERAYTGAAEAYIGLGDTEKAIALLQQGLEQIPDSTAIIDMLNELLPPPESEPVAVEEPITETIREEPYIETIRIEPIILTVYDRSDSRIYHNTLWPELGKTIKMNISIDIQVPFGENDWANAELLNSLMAVDTTRFDEMFDYFYIDPSADEIIIADVFSSQACETTFFKKSLISIRIESEDWFSTQPGSLFSRLGERIVKGFTFDDSIGRELSLTDIFILEYIADKSDCDFYLTKEGVYLLFREPSGNGRMEYSREELVPYSQTDCFLPEFLAYINS